MSIVIPPVPPRLDATSDYLTGPSVTAAGVSVVLGLIGILTVAPILLVLAAVTLSFSVVATLATPPQWYPGDDGDTDHGPSH